MACSSYRVGCWQAARRGPWIRWQLMTADMLDLVELFWVRNRKF